MEHAAGVRALVRIVARRRPAVVVGVGGYASLPGVVAARLRRIPVVVHESDAHPGLANRIAVSLGARPAVSLPGTPLRGAVVTGNPIRPEITAVVRTPVEPPMVAVVGGSLGSRRINDATLDLYDRWRHRDDVVIHHVSGARDYEGCDRRLAALRAPGDRLGYHLVRYEDAMDTLYAEARVMVSRAGGMTAELAAVGMPSVLVPLPGAPGDHQTANALVFAAGGRRRRGARRRARGRPARRSARRPARRPVARGGDERRRTPSRATGRDGALRRSRGGVGACPTLSHRSRTPASSSTRPGRST